MLEMVGKRARRPAMKALTITPRRRVPRREDGGNVADEGEQTTQQPTIDFRREIRMVALSVVIVKVVAGQQGH